YSLRGPIARAAGVDYDVRKVFPYLGYETYDFAVPVRTEGDAYARYLVRVAEMRESLKICRQALERITPTGAYAIDDPRITPPPKDRVYNEMEALIQHFLIYSQGFTVPPGEAYVPAEGPRGEQGFYVVSDGTNRPSRVKSRPPSLLASQAPEKLRAGARRCCPGCIWCSISTATLPRTASVTWRSCSVSPAPTSRTSCRTTRCSTRSPSASSC